MLSLEDSQFVSKAAFSDNSTGCERNTVVAPRQVAWFKGSLPSGLGEQKLEVPCGLVDQNPQHRAEVGIIMVAPCPLEGA